MPILPEIIHTDEPTLSPSQINAYLMCSLKYRFNYIDKLPKPWKSAALAFGSAVHSALETWQMSRLSGEEIQPQAVEDLFLVDWEAEKAGDLLFKDDEESESLRERGRTLVHLAMEMLQPDFPEAVELPFVVDMTLPETGQVLPFKLRGIFDLLLHGDRLVEIKTTSRRFDRETLERHLQLTAYAYAYRQLTGRDAKIEVLALLKTKVPKAELLGTHRDPEVLAWFVNLVCQVHQAIQHHSFFPNPSFLCSDCEYAENCRRWRG